MTRIPFILLSTSDGSPVTGATPTVTISKDGAAFIAATNTPAEIGNGYYYVDLTTAETTVNNNVIVRATATGAQPTAVVWEPEQTIPTAADNATAVWGAQTKEVTIATAQADTFATASSVANIATVANTIKSKTDNLPANPAAVTDITNSQAVIIGAMPTTAGLATTSDVTTAQAAIIEAMPDVSGLATATALTTVGNNVTAVKAKTDNLPQTPAAVGSEMALTEATVTSIKSGLATGDNIEAALGALEMYGDTNWMTADLSDVSTFNASTDAVTLTDAYDAAKTASQLTTSDLSALATSEDITAAQNALTALLNLVLSGLYHWSVKESILTVYNSANVAIGAYTLTKDADGNITAVTPII